MAEAEAFDFVCRELEERTSFDRLEARGTVRLALKQAGLDAGGVTPDEMGVVLERVLPAELKSRGVEDPESVCRAIAPGLGGLATDGAAADTPDAVFRRLGGAG